MTTDKHLPLLRAMLSRAEQDQRDIAVLRVDIEHDLSSYADADCYGLFTDVQSSARTLSIDVEMVRLQLLRLIGEVEAAASFAAEGAADARRAA